MYLRGEKCPSPDRGFSDSQKTPLGDFIQEGKISHRSADLSLGVKFPSVIFSKLSVGAGRKQFLLVIFMTILVSLALLLQRQGSQISHSLFSNSSFTQYFHLPFLGKKDADTPTLMAIQRSHHMSLDSNTSGYLRNSEIYRGHSICKAPILKYYFCKDSSRLALILFRLSIKHKRKSPTENNRKSFLLFDSDLNRITKLKYDYYGNQELDKFSKKLTSKHWEINTFAHYLDLLLVQQTQNSSKSFKEKSYRTGFKFIILGNISLERRRKYEILKGYNLHRRKLKHFSRGKIRFTPLTNIKVRYQFPHQSSNTAISPWRRILSNYAPRKAGIADTPPKPIRHSMPIPPTGLNGSSSGRKNVKIPWSNGSDISESTGISTGSIRVKRSLPTVAESPGGEIYFTRRDKWAWRKSSTSGEGFGWKRFQPTYEENGLLKGSSESSYSERNFSLSDEWLPGNEGDGRKQTSSRIREEQEKGLARIPLSHSKGSTIRMKWPNENGQVGSRKYHLQNKNNKRMYTRNEDGKWRLEIMPLNAVVDKKETFISFKNKKEIYPYNKKTLENDLTSRKNSTVNTDDGKNIGFLLPEIDLQGIPLSTLWDEAKYLENSTSFITKALHPAAKRRDSELKPLINTKHPAMYAPRAPKRKRTERRTGAYAAPGNGRGEPFYEGFSDNDKENRGDGVPAVARYEETPSISQRPGESSEYNIPNARRHIVDEDGREQIKEMAENGITEGLLEENIKVESRSYQEEEGHKGGGQSITGRKGGLPQDNHKNIKAGRLKRKTDLSSVSVIEGEEAALPCNLRSPDPNDTVQIILWIKEGLHTPLYSYDFRELLKGQPKETKPDANSTLSRRTSFRTDRSPAALVIQRIEAEDAGIYRCRVDFLLSPTVNHRINMTVIVPPSRVRITWYSANSTLMTASGNEVGPFLVRSQPTLICTSDDAGSPPPSVVWLEDDQVLDDSYAIDHERNLVENDLTLPPLTRNDLGRRLTCVASNTNRTRPAVMSVRLKLSLRIMGVKVEEIGTIWANEKVTAVCRIWGSHPIPNVLWWLGSRMLSPTETKAKKDDDNITLSYLEFLPAPEDDRAMLICQATNEMLPDLAVQDSTILNVNYAPMASVHLGRSLDPARIKEGDDVYFECSVVSKPPVTGVVWKHDGVKLLAGSGVILSNMSLVVQGVTRSHGGSYTCHASNSRNTTASPPLHLDVKYTPVCASKQMQQHSVGKLENAEISCKVDANPSNVTFRWTFNNTAEAIDVPEGRFVVVGTESRVNYTPMNELDYGTLLCWANNTIGVQQYPCVFQIVAAGKPDPPHNCKVSEVTISSLQVSCLPGDNGGLHQTFLLQVYKVGSTSPVTELSQPHPTFSLTNLTPATSYRIVLAAINEKGASRLKELNAYTSKVPETLEETSAEPARDRERGSSIPLALLIGIIVAVAPIVLASVVFAWLRICRSISNGSRGGGGSGRGSDAGANSENDPNTHSSHSKGDPGSTDVAISELSLFQEDRNPDVVLQASTDSSWPDQTMDIATISAPPYVITEGGQRCPPVSLVSTIASSDCGMHYNQVSSQGTFCLYTQPSPASSQPQQMPVSVISQVPYKTDCAQHQQIQSTTSKSPSRQKCYTININQEESRPKKSSQVLFQGEEFTPDRPGSHAGPPAAGGSNSRPQAFRVPKDSVPKELQDMSLCSVHKYQDNQSLGLQRVSRPVTTCGIITQGSAKDTAQSRRFSQQVLSTSIPAFQSMEDITQCQREPSGSKLAVDPLTASLSRDRKLKRDVFAVPFNTVESQSCQHLIKTLPDGQNKHNKRESAV